jgi:hypothetical protein
LKLARVFALLGTALPALAQYAGPAILTRGEAPAAMAAPLISFRPYLEVSGIYDTGLAGVYVTNPQGDLANTAAAGVELAGGVSGVHSWKHTKVGLDYQGSISHYNKQTYYDSANQSLMLGVTHQFSPHTSLTLRETAGLFSRDFGLLGLPQSVPYDPSQSYVPTTDFFDNRTMYLSTQADFTYQKSARLSFNVGGDGFLVRRRSTALYGVTGAAARGDVQYRVSRRSTIGVNYTYSHFDYTRVFSGTDLQALVGTYAVRLSRMVEFSAYGGAMRVESKFIQSVPVDPAITALLGITSGSQVHYGVNYLPSANGRLSRKFQTGVAYLAGGRTVTPGNGLFLTSSMTTAMAGYSYTGPRHWACNLEAAFEDSHSIENIAGRYRDFSGRFRMSRQIGGAFHAVASITARKYNSPDFSRYNRLVYEARVGIGITPGDVPLRIW